MISQALFAFLCAAITSAVLGASPRPAQDGVRDGGPSSPEQSGAAAFGSRLAVADGRIVVGAQPLRPTEALADSVFVFKREEGVWVEEAKISAPKQAHGRLFGRSLAIQGSRLLVGAPGATMHGDSGRAVLYESVDNGLWEMVQCFEPTSAGAGFGYAVALDGEALVIASPWGPEHEWLEIYGLVGGSWQLRDVVKAPSATGPAGFGAAMTLQGGRLAVLAPHASGLTKEGDSISVYNRLLSRICGCLMAQEGGQGRDTARWRPPAWSGTRTPFWWSV